MKKTFLCAAAALAAGSALFAQNFTADPGYSARSIFNTASTDGAGFVISGLGTDSIGNLYYLETGPFVGGADTRLFKRTVADNFATPVQLFSFNGSVSGNFVKVSGSTVYFGEGTPSGGTIRSISVNGGAATTFASVPGNYDLAIGISGAFVSANSSDSPANEVYKLNLSTGQLDTIVNPTNDYSGPVAVTSSGALLYGATAFGMVAGSVSGGIYSFTASQIASVTDSNPNVSDTSLPLSSGTRKVNDGNNQYLAYLDDQHLFQGNSPFGSAATITRFSLSGSVQEPVGTTGNNIDFVGALALSGSSVYTVVTSDFSSGPSAVYLITAIPEPSPIVLIASACLLGSRRSRKDRRA